MATDFRNIVQIFDTFDNYVVDVTKKCAQFSATATVVGTGIGGLAGGIIDAATADENGKSSGLFGLAGAILGGVIGGAVGESNRQKQLNDCRSQIAQYTYRDKEAYLEMLGETADLTSQQIEYIKANIGTLRNYLLARIAFEENDDPIIETLKDFITQLYQLFYINARSVKIHNYYLDFKEKLDDIENFAAWATEYTFVDREESYFSAFNLVYDKVSENENEENLTKLDYAFGCVAAKVPIYSINLKWAETNPYFIMCDRAQNNFNFTLNKIKKEKIVFQMPKFYYESYGFKKVFNAAAQTYYYGSNKNFRNNARTVLLGIIPAILTAIYALGVYRVLKIPFGMITVFAGSFVFMEIILFILKIIQKRTPPFADYRLLKDISDDCLDYELRRNDLSVDEFPEISSGSEKMIENNEASVDDLLLLQKKMEQSEKNENKEEN